MFPLDGLNAHVRRIVVNIQQSTESKKDIKRGVNALDHLNKCIRKENWQELINQGVLNPYLRVLFATKQNKSTNTNICYLL